jgi:hypothetical protein
LAEEKAGNYVPGETDEEDEEWDWNINLRLKFDFTIWSDFEDGIRYLKHFWMNNKRYRFMDVPK